MPVQSTAVTRLGIAGGIWNRLGGDYSNKAASPPVFSGTISDITGTEGDADIVTDLSTYFSGATSYSILPAVEAGWTFDTGTGILTVDTDVAATFGTYVVTGTNAAGSDDSNAFNVVISASAAAEESPTGGFWVAYEQEQYRREEERKARQRLAKKAKKKAKKIKDKITQALALAEREIEAKEYEEASRKAELVRLTKVAQRYQGEISAISDRIDLVSTEAVEKLTFSMMERFEREISEIHDEEQFLLLATQMLIDQ